MVEPGEGDIPYILGTEQLYLNVTDELSSYQLDHRSLTRKAKCYQ